MSGRIGERLFALLVRLYPRAFRQRYEDELLAFFRQDRAHPKYGAGLLRPVRFWTATVRDLVRAAIGARRTPAPSDEALTPQRARGSKQRPFAHLRNDFRFAWRGLCASPGVTLSALVVLTLGIGAGTAIFSVVDAVALRGLPFAGADRLVSVAETDLVRGDAITVAWQNFAEWRARQDVFEGMAASAHAGRYTTVASPAEHLRAVRITASLFDVLRVSPAIGRPFLAADEQPGAARVAMLSDSLWRRRFAASRDVVGRTLAFETATFEIVGVMPPDFVYPIGSAAVSAIDFWFPIVPTERDMIRTGGRNYSLTVVGRLREGESIARASAQIAHIREALAAEHPRWFVDRGVVVRPMQDAIVGADVRAWMLLLLGAVGCVLLIACLNVANLLLARAVARSREVAVRAALGASPWDLSRAHIVESLMLSFMGATSGVLLAFWGVRVLRATLPEQLPRLATVAVDLRVLSVAALAAIATGLLFGTLPALQLARPDVARTLGQGGRAQTGGSAGARVRTGLVLAEVALAVVLLAGAGLFISSFARVLRIDLGLDPEHVVALGVSPRRGTTPVPPPRPSPAVMQPLIMSAVERARSVPGVAAVAALTSGLPLSGNSMTMSVSVTGDPRTFTGPDEAYVHGASSGYLDVVRATMVRGRWIGEGDTAGAPRVVVLSDEAVRRYYGTRDPLGETILLEKSPMTVVGVIRGIRVGGPESPMHAEAYIPFLQSDQYSADVVFRTGPDPVAITPHVQAAIASAMPNAVVSEPETIEGYFASLVAQRKFNMIVLSLFGTLAVVIASVGIYGLMAFLVGQRTREIGVRIALGAVPGGILQMVLGRAARLMVAGVIVGVAGAAALERVVRTFLFDAQPHDPIVYGAVIVVLLGAGLLAAFGPARHAARVDPLIALRAE